MFERHVCLVNRVAQGYPRAPACAPHTQAGRRRWVTRVRSTHGLELREHAGENLQPQVLFVAQAVGATLDDADLVVESLDESERHLVLRLAVGGDPIPMALDHFGEL